MDALTLVAHINGLLAKTQFVLVHSDEGYFVWTPKHQVHAETWPKEANEEGRKAIYLSCISKPTSQYEKTWGIEYRSAGFSLHAFFMPRDVDLLDKVKKVLPLIS